MMSSSSPRLPFQRCQMSCDTPPRHTWLMWINHLAGSCGAVKLAEGLPKMHLKRIKRPESSPRGVHKCQTFQAVVWCLIMFSTEHLVILGVSSFEPHPFVKASCSRSSTRLCIPSDSQQVTEEQCEQPASQDVVKFLLRAIFPLSLLSLSLLSFSDPLYCSSCFPVAAGTSTSVPTSSKRHRWNCCTEQ